MVASKQRNKHENNRRAASHGNWSSLQSSRLTTKWSELCGWAIVIVVAAAPLGRGLYFPSDFWPAFILLLTAYGAWLWNHNGLRMQLTLLDLGVLILAAAYFLGIAYGAVRQVALEQSMVMAACVIVYLFFSRLQPEEQERAGQVIASLAVVVTVVGVLAANGYMKITDVMYANRFSSTLQYPNALGAYLVATYMILLASTSKGNGPRRSLWGAGASLLAWGLVMTVSRGALVVALPAGLFYVLLCPVAERAREAARGASAGAIGTAAAVAYSRLGSTGGPAKLIILAAAAVTATLVWYAIDQLLERAGSKSSLVLGIVGVVIVVVAGVSLYAGGVVQTLAARFGSIRDVNNFTRIEYLRDALRIFVAHPLFGTGGGGWEYYYPQVQRVFYASRTIHNSFMQIAVDTGIFGLSSWVLCWIAGVRGFIRRERRDPWMAGVAAALLAIGAHSLIDFSLSIPSMALLFWAMAGVVRSVFGAEDGNPLRDKGVTISRGVYAGVGTVLVFLAATQLMAAGYARAGERALAIGDNATALSSYKSATALAPLNGEYRLRLGLQLMWSGNQNGDGTAISTGRTQLLKAVKLAPQIDEVGQNAAAALFQYGYVDDALAILKQLVKLRPLLPNHYEDLAAAYVALAERDILSGKVDQARGWLDQAAALATLRQTNAAKQPPGLPDQLKLAPTGPMMEFRMATVSALRGDLDSAKLRIDDALATEASTREMRLWRAAVAAVQGDEARAQDVLRTLAPLAPAEMQAYGRIVGALKVVVAKHGS